MSRELYIVDDNSDHHFLLYKTLKQLSAPYPVRFFQDGKALHGHLMTLVQQEKYDDLPGLIILDLNMPGINGLQLLQLLKKPAQDSPSQLRSIPVIIMSSETRIEKINQCYHAGANAFIAKPMHLDELKNVLETTCAFWLEINYVPQTSPQIFK